MAEEPLVSIVTPSYNKGCFIEETILSVKNQTYPHIEHIVIDGGSTDGTMDTLRRYSDSLSWISEPDKGQSDAINKGWRMARGDILAYLNADDTYLPWTVHTAVQFLTEHPDVDMVYGDCNFIDEHDNVMRQYVAKEFRLRHLLCLKWFIPQPTVFLTRQVLDSTGYLDADLHMAMDHDLWIRIGLRHEISYIPKVLANFRVCAGTKSVDSASNFGPDHFRMLDKLYSDPTLPGTIRTLKRSAYGAAHLYSAKNCHAAHQMRRARQHLAKALLLHPRYLLEDRSIIAYLITSFLGTPATDVVVK